MTSGFNQQSNALFRNKATYQKRNIATNICLLSSPIFFCILLAIIQIVVNRAFTGLDTFKCGCRCDTCCLESDPNNCPLRDGVGWNGTDVDQRFYVCDEEQDLVCQKRDKQNCGIQYSSATQIGFCGVPRPASWPASTSVPNVRRRAKTERPAAQSLITAATKAAAQQFAGAITRNKTITADLFVAPNRTLANNIYYSVTNVLGLLIGTSADPPRNYFVDYTFVTTNSTFIMLPNGTCAPFYGAATEMPSIAPRLVTLCEGYMQQQIQSVANTGGSTIITLKNGTTFDLSNPAQAQQYRLFRSSTCGTELNARSATLSMQEFLQVSANISAGGSLTVADLDDYDTAKLLAVNTTAGFGPDDLTDFNEVRVSCADSAMVLKETAAALEDELYCGYWQTRCGGVAQTNNMTAAAFDFFDSGAENLNVAVYVNRTATDNDNGPDRIIRINGLITQAVTAWWKVHVDNVDPEEVPPVELLGVMSTPKKPSELKLDFSSLLGPLFYTWVVQLLFPTFLQQLVYEKEKRLRMMMKMHGLGDVVYWLVTYIWFLTLYVVYIIIFIVFGFLINLKMFRKTQMGIQIIFYFLHGNCMIAFAFVLSSFFTSSRVAVVFAFLYVFATGLIGELLLRIFMEKDALWVFFMQWVPAWSLYRGLQEMSAYTFLAVYRNEKRGMEFENLSDDGNGMTTTWIIFAVEWAIFLPLAWYLEQVIPTGNGIRRHPLFFLGFPHAKKDAHGQRLSDTGERASHSRTSAPSSAVAVAVPEGEMQDVQAERERVDALRDTSNYPIVCRDLRKTFPGVGGGKKKVAVRTLTLGVERGECFGLLGPNGAGKTTSISMLNGFLEPSGGTALVEGFDIRTQMKDVYKQMGVCPQHDLLWEQLTAREHLLFYGRLKGLKGDVLNEAVEKGLRSVNLFNVADKQSGKYSGGMKRRLSVAISFIGTPGVVYLDEPSTGLDPASRRSLWDVVKTSKEGKAIILTTHSMEEAEMLCDRLGIFVDGQLVCIGNPKEITSRYAGYYVFTIMVPQHQEPSAREFVARLSPSAVLTYALGGTLKYELPTSEVTLSQVFAVMNQAKQEGKLNIMDWSVANATLEEVFIKLARSIGASSKDS